MPNRAEIRSMCITVFCIGMSASSDVLSAVSYCDPLPRFANEKGAHVLTSITGIIILVSSSVHLPPVGRVGVSTGAKQYERK